jgi:hypothetical protein
MRYALRMHYREPGEGEISEDAIAEATEAFGAYGRALESAGVLLSADVLQPTAATTTVTRREGVLRVQDGPFAEMKEALADCRCCWRGARRCRGPPRCPRPRHAPATRRLASEGPGAV